MLSSLGEKYFGILTLLLGALAVYPTPASAAPGTRIKTVFIIVMENRNWTGTSATDLKGNPNAPYINNVLVPMASHAEQYYNPPDNHPSLPNYFWLQAGTNFGVMADGLPSHYAQHTNRHLVSLLEKAGVSWKAYVENITGKTCPLKDSRRKDSEGHALYYAPVDPFVYFDDITNDQHEHSANCVAHIRPYGQLARDLASGQVAQYNWITPNLCDDMHDACGGDPVKHGDRWLSQNVPAIINSAVFKAGGALFVTWDEAHSGDGPVPMIVVSPFAKGGGYSNSIHYTHGATLHTMETIFGVKPLLGEAADEPDLGDLFNQFP